MVDEPQCDFSNKHISGELFKTSKPSELRSLASPVVSLISPDQAYLQNLYNISWRSSCLQTILAIVGLPCFNILDELNFFHFDQNMVLEILQHFLDIFLTD